MLFKPKKARVKVSLVRNFIKSWTPIVHTRLFAYIFKEVSNKLSAFEHCSRVCKKVLKMKKFESSEVSEVFEKKWSDCSLYSCLKDQLLAAFDCRDIYEFQLRLHKVQSKLNTSNQILNDLEAFDVILSTLKSGKFIELCLSAGASFYKVKWPKC
jgi:hypothetical protein